MSVERIKQLRSQMLIHSYLYYWQDDPIWSDDKWQQNANELRDLQGEGVDIGWYDREFKGWDGSTGHHLPVDEWVKTKATYIRRVNTQYES